jgi:hypothetical protein
MVITMPSLVAHRINLARIGWINDVSSAEDIMELRRHVATWGVDIEKVLQLRLRWDLIDELCRRAMQDLMTAEMMPSVGCQLKLGTLVDLGFVRYPSYLKPRWSITSDGMDALRFFV